ncbi:MAG: hypothetical protein LBD23_13890 [Oscillospiraceae bacterium]|jgi:hypothetical protein|nr:hypothetical protein [Oscillospiraceae bacterium]
MTAQLAMPKLENQQVQAQNAYIGQEQYFGPVIVNYNNAHKPSPPRSNSHCNIFVLTEQSYGNSGFFIVEKDYVSLNGNLLTDITQYPAIFMNRNYGFGQCADHNQAFYYGQITSVTSKNGHYEICYTLKPTRTLSQRTLNTVADEIGINIEDGRDILDLKGWTVRPINIKEALENKGFDLSDVTDY